MYQYVEIGFCTNILSKVVQLCIIPMYQKRTENSKGGTKYPHLSLTYKCIYSINPLQPSNGVNGCHSSAQLHNIMYIHSYIMQLHTVYRIVVSCVYLCKTSGQLLKGISQTTVSLQLHVNALSNIQHQYSHINQLL